MEKCTEWHRRVCFVATAASFFLLSMFPAPRLQEKKGTSPEWRVPRRAARKKNKVPADAASVALGKELFKRECLSCHGPEGKGNGPAAKDLEKEPGNLSDPKMWEQSDGALYWKIKTGRTPMPSFVTLLANKDIWHVINFLRTLSPRLQPTPPAFRVPMHLKSGVSKVLSPYLSVVEALRRDDVGSARKATRDLLAAANRFLALDASGLDGKLLAQWKGSVEKTRSAAVAFSPSGDLNSLRSSLKTMSEAITEVLQKFGHSEQEPMYVFLCPEAGHGTGATWVQRGGRPKNPYLGMQKASCGEIRGILGGGILDEKNLQKGRRKR